MRDGERIDDVSDDTLPYALPARQQNSTPARQVFGVIVRTVGLLLAVYGLYFLLVAVSAKVGLAYDGSLTPDVYFVYGVFWVGVGAALLKCGWLLRFAYGRET
jgi:hypothetical protein